MQFLKDKSRIRTITDIDMLLIVEKWIRGGTCHFINSYKKANNKYKEDCNKNIESSYLKHWDASNVYPWAMSQR